MVQSKDQSKEIIKTAQVLEESAVESAKVLEESAVEQVDSADRRTELAANRTVLASERTYAAWIRTGIAAFASALGVKALLVEQLPHWMVQLVASTLLLIGALCF